MSPRALAALALVASAAEAGDRCVAVKATHTPPRADTLGLLLDPDLPAEVGSTAIRLWSRCAEYGTGFPTLRVDEHGTQTLRVEYDPASIGEGRCGSFRGRRVLLHAWMLDADGRILPCGPLALNLAHELGHALGLADSRETGCRHFVMAPILVGQPTLRRPRPAECAALAERWMTSRELRAAPMSVAEAPRSPVAERDAWLSAWPVPGGGDR